MLALAKAIVVDPELLVIDEFSLGLAPVVVSGLVELVRRLNERGAAVLLVEQSVSTALSLVDRAYLMEKGAIVAEHDGGRAAGGPRAGPHPDAGRPRGGGLVTPLLALAGFDVGFDRLVIGIFTGLTYGLLATGLVLVYRSSRFVNFAHGSVGAFGASVLGLLVVDLGAPYWVAFPVAIAVAAALSGLVEVGVVRRLAHRPSLIGMIATLGLSQFILVLALIINTDARQRLHLPRAGRAAHLRDGHPADRPALHRDAAAGPGRAGRARVVPAQRPGRHRPARRRRRPRRRPCSRGSARR